jgi:hypothetical protein
LPHTGRIALAGELEAKLLRKEAANEIGLADAAAPVHGYEFGTARFQSAAQLGSLDGSADEGDRRASRDRHIPPQLALEQ